MAEASLIHSTFCRAFTPGVSVPALEKRHDTHDIEGSSVFPRGSAHNRFAPYIIRRLLDNETPEFHDATNFYSYMVTCGPQDSDDDAKGDAQFLHTWFGGPTPRVVYDPDEDTWFVWKGHCWVEDITVVPWLIHTFAARRHAHQIYAAETIDRHYKLKLESLQDKVNSNEGGAEDKLKEFNETFSNFPFDAITSMVATMDKRKCALKTQRGINGVLFHMKVLFSFKEYKNEEGKQVEWDTQKTKIACPNGLLDMETGQLRNGHPLDFNRTCIPTEWKGLDEPCPRFMDFLDQILPNDPDTIRWPARTRLQDRNRRQ